MSIELISPYGGKLVDLQVPEELRRDLLQHASDLPSVQLSERALCDLELLGTAAFSPLDRFMGPDDHQSVLEQMRLSSGAIFPIPVTLPVPDDFQVKLDHEISLRDARNENLAIMMVEAAYEWNFEVVASQVAGTIDPRHP